MGSGAKAKGTRTACLAWRAIGVCGVASMRSYVVSMGGGGVGRGVVWRWGLRCVAERVGRA